MLLGSDKAHLTDHSGDKSAWPVYLSLGNIHSSVRNKPSAQCWVLIAYIPIPVFTDPKTTGLHTALQQHLFHQCLKIIVSSLEGAGKHGADFVDSLGDVRHCYPQIAAYLADYPEQIMINVTPSLSSPVTTAGFEGLGDSTPHPRRTKEWILSRIRILLDCVDPDDVVAYMDAAKKLGLSAVDQPFWQDLPGYRPDLVICPDILHGLFRMWRDHVLKWVQHLIGKPELDRRLKVLQPLIGMRHFQHGITHLSQWTGREDRELQRVLLAVIAGAPRINKPVMRCLRAFHDFLYLAQYRSHTTTTLGYLEQSLKVFHSLKKIFITNGARRGKKVGIIPHFCFPKMAGLHMYAYHIPRMGTSVQFSTEITETCHQIMAKAAYKATNHKDFFVQMCAFMNRLASLALMEELGTWCFDKLYAQLPAEELRAQAPDFISYAQRRSADEKKEKSLEVKNKDRAKSGYVWLNIKPDVRRIPIEIITEHYGLQCDTFQTSLIAFISRHCPDVSEVPIFGLLAEAWYRCRIQRLTIQDADELSDARTIRAEPPSYTKTKHGHCNCALINENDELPETGIAGMIHWSDCATVLTAARLSDSSSPYDISTPSPTKPSTV